ncbi:MAG: fibronectin type III domain-containing protein [Candidatus Polarisedimenticolia bacterium]
MSPSNRRRTLAGLIALAAFLQPSWAATTGVLVIDWDANQTDVDLNGYRVYLSTDSGVFDLSPAQARAQATTRAVPPDTLDTTFSSLETTSTYYIAVTSFDSSGNESAFSPVVAAQPCDTTTSGSLTVSWDQAAGTESSYIVYVAEDPSLFDLPPAEALPRARTRSVAPGSGEAQFTGLDAEKTYYVSVTSQDAGGRESTFGEVLAVTPTLMPTLCSVEPYSGGQGIESVSVTLYGANLAQGATVDFGPDILVRSLDTSGAPARVVATLDIGPFAQADSRDVTITNPDGGLSIIPEGFDVLVNLGRADINGSSRIDGGDMVQVAAAFTARSGEPRYSINYDLNVDGVVDGTDLSLLILYFGMLGPF